MEHPHVIMEREAIIGIVEAILELIIENNLQTTGVVALTKLLKMLKGRR